MAHLIIGYNHYSIKLNGEPLYTFDIMKYLDISKQMLIMLA